MMQNLGLEIKRRCGIVSDRRYTSCHSHQIKMFGNSEQVQYWCQLDEYWYYEHLSESYQFFWIVSDKWYFAFLWPILSKCLYQTRYILRRRLYIDWTYMGTCTGTCMGVVLIIHSHNKTVAVLSPHRWWFHPRCFCEPSRSDTLTFSAHPPPEVQ